MNLSKLKQWTPFTFIDPSKYIENNRYWRSFDFYEWSEEHYEWVSDGWSGYKDFAQPPSKTLAIGEGDCEDYAIVAASWAVSGDHKGVRLGFCWEKWKPHPTHAICYDREAVYSSGEIYEGDVEEWLSDSKYSVIVGRLVK